MSDDVELGFSEEQKQYLQGFLSGTALAQSAPGAGPSPSADLQRQAQDRYLAAGQKLTAEEQAKRSKKPFEMWDEITSNAATDKFPKGTDVFLYKFHGLFYVSPAQNAYMCRLRFHGGIVSAHQLRGLADLADGHAGGYADVTTRANLQLREIGPGSAAIVLETLHDLGVINRGSGADNIRNVTGSPTAGIDPAELIDVRPLCRRMHHYILEHPEMYGLPRKFNIAFDGGGTVSAVADTNDVGFYAVRMGEDFGFDPGVYFQLHLGGITGHLDFAQNTGVLLTPDECVPVAGAIVRAFIQHGDRTDRKRARLKYVLERLGVEGFLTETEQHLGRPLRRAAAPADAGRAKVDRWGHVGWHPQKQAGLWYVGVTLPVGRLTAAQMRGLAEIAERYGSRGIRLTVWQNLLISDIAHRDRAAVEQALADLGLSSSASSYRAGLVACTGNGGCKFAASNTKQDALDLAARLESSVPLDEPLNIHLTGCHHSCAQHYIGDIGLLATKIPRGDEQVEGYHVYLGGGFEDRQAIAREVFRDVPTDDLGPLIEQLIRRYLEQRSANESFHEYARRHSVEQLRAPLTLAAV